MHQYSSSSEIFTPSPGSTIDLALKEGLTFYDSSYLVAAMESGYEFVKKLGKTAIKVNKDTAGFVVNRISAYWNLYSGCLFCTKAEMPSMKSLEA